MRISQKSLYALRAIFELAKCCDGDLVKIVDIAEAQAIPKSFLEVILGQLKQGGFVESRRGSGGGYVLVRDPKTLTVAEIMEFIHGPVGPIPCLMTKFKADKCSLHSSCIFKGMWERVHDAIAEVYTSTTIADLVKQEQQGRLCDGS